MLQGEEIIVLDECVCCDTGKQGCLKHEGSMLHGEEMIVLDECVCCGDEEENGDPGKDPNFSRELSTSSEDSPTSPDKVHTCSNCAL